MLLNNEKFNSWIKTILESSMISISFNGISSRFFNCEGGVRQGDPISHLLFYIVEEVISRSITMLVEKGRVKTIPGPEVL